MDISNHERNMCDICASRGPCMHCGRSGSYRIEHDFVGYLKTKSEFYRLEKLADDIVCKKLIITIDNLGGIANMITLRFRKKESPLVGWPSFEQIFEDKQIESVCTSYLDYDGANLYLICALR